MMEHSHLTDLVSSKETSKNHCQWERTGRRPSSQVAGCMARQRCWDCPPRLSTKMWTRSTHMHKDVLSLHEVKGLSDKISYFLYWVWKCPKMGGLLKWKTSLGKTILSCENWGMTTEMNCRYMVVISAASSLLLCLWPTDSTLQTSCLFLVLPSSAAVYSRIVFVGPPPGHFQKWLSPPSDPPVTGWTRHLLPKHNKTKQIQEDKSGKVRLFLKIINSVPGVL